MSVIAPGALFPATTVADGIVVAERAQTTGECQQSDSSAHLFVLQSAPVKRALQVWEGAHRTGSMLPGHLSVFLVNWHFTETAVSQGAVGTTFVVRREWPCGWFALRR